MAAGAQCTTLRILIRAALCVAALLISPAALPVRAQEPQVGTAAAALPIYNGITEEELAAFAERQGWSTKVSGSMVEIGMNGSRALVQLLSCADADKAGQRRCRGGVIRTISYHFVEPTRHGFWHWNLETHGATGYGPSYVTLERYLHFAGVTDQYLREVIGEIWPKASADFWQMVEEME